MAETPAAVQVIEVAAEEAGSRLDRWFKRRYPAIGHGKLEKLLRTGQVRVDGKRAKAGVRLETGQQVRVPPLGDEAAAPRRTAPTPRVPAKAADAIVASVLHRDDDVIAINKPAGLAVQGGTKTGLNVDAMLDALRFGSAHRPRLVHRLDKDTSGVLLLARHPAAAAALAEAFRSKAAVKLYWAVVAGLPKVAEGKIDLPLDKVPGPRGEQVVATEGDGKRAVTVYRVIDHVGRRASWLAMSPFTGRTHQLRVHAAAMGHPILGDGKYGGAEAFLGGDVVSDRLHLHARRVRLPHPAGGELSVTAPLPPAFTKTLEDLGFDLTLADNDFPA